MSESAVNTFRLKYNCLPGDCANATQFFNAASQPEKVQNGGGNGIVAGLSYGTNSLPHTGCSSANYNSNANPATIGWINPVSCGSYYDVAEWLTAWDHLAAAGLAIDGISQFDETSGQIKQGVQYPKMKVQDPSTTTWQYAIDHGAQADGGIVFGYVPSISVSPYMRSGNKIMLGMCEDPLVSGGNFTWCGLSAWTTVQIDNKIDDGKPFSGIMVNLGGYHPYRTALVWGDANNNTETAACAWYASAYTNNVYFAQGALDYHHYSLPIGTRGCTPYIDAQF